MSNTNLETATRNAMNDARCALANGGTLEIRVDSTVLAEVQLQDPAFLPSASGSAGAIGENGVDVVSVLNPLPFTGTANGTANNYRVRDSGGDVIWSSASGLGGLTLSNPNIAIDQDGFVVAWLTTQPAT